MANETNLSVAIIEPRKGLFSGAKAVDKQVASVANAEPDLIILPRYRMKVEDVDHAYETAKKIKPDIALFSQTQFAQRIDPYAKDNRNPLQRLNYKVEDSPYRVLEGLNLDMLVLFGGEKIDPESPLFTNLRPGGYLIWLDDHENSEVMRRNQGGSEPWNYRVFENIDKMIKHCSWYDLKF